jgi:hypothetical protein
LSDPRSLGLKANRPLRTATSCAAHTACDRMLPRSSLPLFTSDGKPITRMAIAAGNEPLFGQTFTSRQKICAGNLRVDHNALLGRGAVAPQRGGEPVCGRSTREVEGVLPRFASGEVPQPTTTYGTSSTYVSGRSIIVRP